jgi:hypothetical protein
MSTIENVGDSKNFFCRDEYWQLMNSLYQRQVFKSIKGATLRKCTRSNCRGAHCESEIQTRPSVHQFKVCDKSKINLVAMYNSIRDEFKNSLSKVKHQEYIDMLENYETMNFVELLNLWFDITCFYRKLKKDMNKGIAECSLYSSTNEIPEFFIEEENHAWELERLTKMCPKSFQLNQKIKNNEKPILWDICIGSINCKKGCHNVSYMVCNDDLMHGNCQCISSDKFESTKESIKQDIQKYSNLLSPKEDNNGFKSKVKPRKVRQYQDKIKQLQNQMNTLIRKVHLTEEGLIPFDIQMKLHFEELAKQEKERKEKIELQASKKEERMDQLKNSKVKKVLRKPKF